MINVKVKIHTPFFEVGVKNYLYGDDVLQLAKAADAAAIKYDIDVFIFGTICRHSQSCGKIRKKLIVFAPYMDVLYPGRGMADVLPESVKAAGAKGVVLNHCERPMTLSKSKKKASVGQEN